jgi:hypothetical protein
VVPEVLERNVGDLAVQICLMVREAISALSPIYARTDAKQVESLARRADALKSELWNAFQRETAAKRHGCSGRSKTMRRPTARRISSCVSRCVAVLTNRDSLIHG